ncbi:MAG TPA: hypothetical protein VN457_00590 [Chlamydiales bacterium]|nr:hypothetical protein [Chlamydiales bacterium]
MLSFGHDFTKDLPGTGIVPATVATGVLPKSTVSKDALRVCLNAIQSNYDTDRPKSSLLPELWEIVLAFTESFCQRLLCAAQEASDRGDFIADDFCTESSVPDEPKSVFECIQKHVNNPELERNPEVYMKQWGMKLGSGYGFESKAKAFIEKFLAAEKGADTK